MLTRSAIGDRDPLLNNAIRFARERVPVEAKSEKTWGNVVATVRNWYSTLLQNRDLIQWSTCATSEANILSCTTGYHVGIYLPERYGLAGKMMTALIFNAVDKPLRERGRDYKLLDPTQRPVLTWADEAQEILTKAQGKKLSMGREADARFLISSQSIPALVERVGAETWAAMEKNFLNMIVMRCDETSFGEVQKRLGKTKRRKKSSSTANQIDWTQTVNNYLSNPINDPNHPEAESPYFEKMDAENYAMPIVGIVESRTREGRRVDVSYDDANEFNAKQSRFTNFVVASNEEEQWLLEKSDYDALKTEPHLAIASIMRGGVQRRDIIRTTPMYEIPLHLFNNKS